MYNNYCVGNIAIIHNNVIRLNMHAWSVDSSNSAFIVSDLYYCVVESAPGPPHYTRG